MIAHCTHCQAKFRIADDKIGPRGAKVRCSHCKTVFAVRRPDAPPVAAPPEPRPAPLPPPGPALPGPADPFAEPAFAAAQDPFAADPFAAPRPPVQAPAPDPFGPDPFAGPARGAPAADPFALETPPTGFAGPDGADPFAFTMGDRPGAEAAAGPADPFAPEAGGADPFAAALAGAADPFAASVSPRRRAAAAEIPAGLAAPAPGAAPGGSSALPLTDLSDLLGDAPAPPPPLPAPPALAPEPLPPAGGLDLAFPPEPAPGLPAGLALELAGPSELEAPLDPPAPPPAMDLDLAGGPDLGLPGGPLAGPDLALEERSTPAPARLDEPPLEDDPFARAAPWAAGGGDAGPNELSFADRGEETLALATEPSGPQEAPPPLPPEPPRPARAAAVAEAPAEASARDASRPAGPRGGRLRSMAVNAAALAALLLVALAFRVAWRGDAPLEPGAFRPSSVLGAVGVGERAAGPLSVAELRSGLYDRARGGPVLFVRGKVVSRAPSPVARARVEVELVRDGQVIARGTAPAGAVATPEELHGAGGAAELEAVARAVEARAPARIRPGESLPFLVVLPDAPDDLAGATVRVAAIGGVEAAAR
ncbi:MJ0042 family finger-like protein [Anaeromyxobacter dehalogenans 2CP-1]|uniref:MJ0042 family finger-like protein n=1 Tax=Anaeromyxobacter dehalogenans (strain ATCC BAA-258 / DSM 21875 / 2CP-1) TaxID=455488 RepID=B8JEL7_ANAD2|nr:zinc-ribbon domain-containing protein [Anaeromyxobacter dehalogenans]ACL64343.1 MJ0042 family finger-like protein [Anaeromyxobacter dehalogenans 2CP-1]